MPPIPQAKNANGKSRKKLRCKNEDPTLVLVTGCLKLTSLRLANMNLDRSPSRLLQIEAKPPFHITSPSEQQIGRPQLFQRMRKVMMSSSRTPLLSPLPLSFYPLNTILIIRFSVSKWIHLNSGDQGLKHFFHRVHSVLNSRGTFVLEPQPWDSYAKARRMDQVCIHPFFLTGLTYIIIEAQRKCQST